MSRYMILDPKGEFYGSLLAPGVAGAADVKAIERARPGSILKSLRNYLARAKMIGELNSLSDRMLMDIGLSRADIPAVVDGVARRAGRKVDGGLIA